MRYILANDQEEIWDTRRTMASHPELQLCRRFLRVPGYGSLWHPGRGWIAFPSPISGGSVFCILRFLRAGSRSEVLYWSSLSYNEEEKAEHLTRIAINRASHMMNAAASCYNSNYWGSDSDSSKGILDSVHKPALDVIKVLIGGGIDLSKEVHSMPALDATKVLIGSRIDLSKEVRMHPMPGLLDFFMGCLQSKAREIDLSKELHLLARIEHALSKMHNELSAMLFIMPSFASLIYRRPSIEITGLLSEFVHLVLQRAKRRTNNTVLSLPYVCIGEMCYEWFFGCRILMNLSEGLAIHFINEAISHGPKWDKARQTFLQKLPPKVSVHPSLNELREYDVVAAKAEGDRLRNEFLERAELKPPQVLRMIDCKATRDEGQVVLMDWKDCEQAWGYSTISHTYGQDVYQVFNCTCASICRAAQKPRCSFDTCPHDPAAPNAAHTATQTRVVRDILNMCGTLCDAGVRYAWHDGVCIAQQDEDEVRETIQHIGWVYSNGRETIIFLHYVGKPMAPIRVSYEDPVCRWHTRVWTLQEAALSKHRRYCIRVGNKAIGKCESLEDFIKNVDLLYEDESSSVEVVEEERFYDILKLLSLNILSALKNGWGKQAGLPVMLMLGSWNICIRKLVLTVESTCFRFPTIDDALRVCGMRESKHRGDRMNSILTLAGVKGFVAPKDSNVEASTLEFFEKQGEKGLARALFGSNYLLDDPAHELRRHTCVATGAT